MRIDKYLKNSRIIKRRSVAKEACEQERITVNGKIAKPGTEVEVGDTITVKVLDTKDSQRKEDADKMYEVL